MLKAIGWIFKTALFALLVLVLGNLITWRGETISDQVRMGLSHAEPSRLVERVKSWSSQLNSDARAGARRRVGPGGPQSKAEPARAPREEARGEDTEIVSSERQKLRALIQELSQDRGRD